MIFYTIMKYGKYAEHYRVSYHFLLVLVEKMTSLGEFSRPASTWEQKWAESSLFVNHVADEPGDTLDFNHTSSVVTASTMPVSEYQHRVHTDTQMTAKTRSSILKKK